MTSLLSNEPKRRRAFAASIGQMVLWSVGLLLLIHLITWLGPKKDGLPMLPGWAELVVWAQFILPVVPAVIAGTARIRGHEKWKPILLGAVMGVLTPLFSLAILIATFLAIGGSIDLGPDNDNISAALILSTLFATTILLGVSTGSLRHKPPRTI